MPDIFLSYSRENQPVARLYAEGFEREGFSVWWDQELQAGEAFDQVTEKALSEAKVVVVLWSKASVDSRWVRAEATQAHAMNRLVPVMIQPCKRPIMFELTHTADLAGWEGDGSHPAWRSLVAGIRRMTGAVADAAATTAGATRAASSPRRQWPLIVAAAAMLVAVLLGSVLFMRKDGGRVAEVPVENAATAPSIAVLPFVNLTSDPEQEYFSDGLTEELLNELAQIQGLRVIGRTSSFAFKGRNEDTRRIGEILGVNHILVGSVRKSGGRLRIGAQLINPADGSNLWSKVYERKQDDVFTIQEEIAATVAGALRVALAGRAQQEGGTRNFAAYDAMLAGRASLNSVNFSIRDGVAVGHFERAVKLDPNYLTAWIWLIDSYTRALFEPARRLTVRPLQADAIEKVVEQAPNSVFASLARSYGALVEGNLRESDQLLSASLDAPPGLGERARLRYGQFLQAAGRARDAVEILKQAVSADPLDVFFRLQLVVAYEVSGDLTRAAEARDALLAMPGGDASIVRAQQLTAAMASGDNAEVSRLVRESASSESVVIDVLKKHDGDLKAALPEINRLLDDSRYNQSAFMVVESAGWAGYLGDTALALKAMRHAANMGLSYETWAGFIWRNTLRDTRRTAGFKALVRELNLDSYWRSTGNWGDFCKPVGSDDFECQ